MAIDEPAGTMLYAGLNNGTAGGADVYKRLLIVGITPVASTVPEGFSLSQNYPNPFNPYTKIKVQIPQSGLVKISVYDLLGREVRTIVNEHLSPGTYEADFDGTTLNSGVYIYKMQAGSYVETRKMMLVK